MKVDKKDGSADALPSGIPTDRADPDFNDELPGLNARTVGVDPDAADFRDAIQVGSYAAVGALQSEMDRERQEAEQATLDALEAMRAMDSGDQVKWRISRTGHESDELNGYLETWPNHLMTIERLRDRFGGGTFYCKGFRKGRYCAHQVLQISGEAKRKPSGVEGVNQSQPVNATSGFDVQGFLVAQERRDERRREQERQDRAEREEREEKRRQERLQLLLTLGPAAISAMGGLFAGRPDNTAALVAALKPPDPLTMLTQLKALQGNGQDGVLNKVLPMLIDMAGTRASGGDTGWLDVIKEFAKGAGPAIGGMIEAQVSAARMAQGSVTAPGPSGSTPSTGQAILPPPQPSIIMLPESVQRRERRSRIASEVSPAASQASLRGMRNPTRRDGSASTAGVSSHGMTAEHDPHSARGQVDMNLMALAPHYQWLVQMLARLFEAAWRDKDPELYAALFLEELPDGIDTNVVGQLLAAQDWAQRLISIDPRWNNPQVLPWLQTVRGLILQSLSQETGGDPVHFAQHAPAQRVSTGSAPGRYPEQARVDVRGPAADTQASSPDVQPPLTGSAPKPSNVTGPVIDRPTKLPSLTGD